MVDMDIELKNKLNETIEQLRRLSVIEDLDYDQMDPVLKMMLVALVNEEQKIQDYVDGAAQKIIERYCTDFIPREQVGATPAITLLHPTFRKKDAGIISVDSGAIFTYKSGTSKLPINYIPIFNTSLISYSDLFVLTYNKLLHEGESWAVEMGRKNQVWVGIVMKNEVECLQGISMLIKGTGGVYPERILVGVENSELEFSTMREMENIKMAEPFDAQQSSRQFFSFVNIWKECLLNMEDASLLYVTDSLRDRDIFKPRAYPKVFQQWLENDTLDSFDDNTLWLRLDFPDGYSVPDSFRFSLNVLPVVNVDVNSLTLTQASPIAKLQKQEDSFFLRVLETSSASHKQGFNMSSDEIIIRDFDASCYHNGDLYREVRQLYNRFIDDYYAFIEYNGIKDGEVLKKLRETINKLGKSVGQTNAKFKFDSGTYVMKNMDQYPPTSSTKVSYLTTQGKIGNAPKEGDLMENKKVPGIEQKIPVIVSAMGGTDKATPDERYELLRYYSLTNDRLYTKMDVDAFLRKEIIQKFGKSEFRRIFVKISIEGAGGAHFLQRGLYIDIEFKDKKNYEKALRDSFDKFMQQKIEGKSCIAMPIIVQLKNLEE